MPETKTSKKIFIAPLNWGLGHATRILPLIRFFLEKGFIIYLAASGRSRELLEKEIKQCQFVDFPEYPIKYPRTRFFVTRFMLIIFPRMLLSMLRENKKLKYLHNKYQFDLIISDNRFALALKNVPSYLISHQLRYKLPWPFQKLEWLPEFFNYTHFRKYDRIIVPDSNDNNCLTGELSHAMRFIDKDKLIYAGIFADLDVETLRGAVTNSIDYFVIISGPEPQRTFFEKLIFQQVNRLNGKSVVALGVPEKDYKIRMGSSVIYTYINRKKMTEFMKKANFIIARPGYTTVMEMVELGKKGLFIPTPGQIEQEYLAKYFMQKGWCYSVSQYGFDLADAVEIAKKYHGFPENYSGSKQNLEKLYSDEFRAKLYG